MSGIFGDIDWGNVQDDPFQIPDNSYVAYVTKVTVGPTKAGDKIGMTLIYTIDGGQYNGRDVTEWKQIPQVTDPKNLTTEEARSLSFLKQRMLQLGVPEGRLANVSPDDLIGIRCVITVRTKGEYTNVIRCQQVGDEFTLSSEL